MDIFYIDYTIFSAIMSTEIKNDQWTYFLIKEDLYEKVWKTYRIPILILSVLLLVPAAIGYFNTKVNYDILYYLPGDIDTMKGQDILLDDFGKGAYAMVVVDGMNKKNVSELVKKVEKVDHVASVISYNGIVGDGVPAEILPDKFRSYFENDDSGATLFAIFLQHQVQKRWMPLKN